MINATSDLDMVYRRELTAEELMALWLLEDWLNLPWWARLYLWLTGDGDPWIKRKIGSTT